MFTRPPPHFSLKPVALGSSLLATALLLAACGGSDGPRPSSNQRWVPTPSPS